MRELALFLLARITEDEAALDYLDDRFGIGGRWREDCETKRRMVNMIAVEPRNESLEGTDVLRMLALPYAEHDDYRPEWRI
jgi:hypothetical protein